MPKKKRKKSSKNIVKSKESFDGFVEPSESKKNQPTIEEEVDKTFDKIKQKHKGDDRHPLYSFLRFIAFVFLIGLGLLALSVIVFLTLTPDLDHRVFMVNYCVINDFGVCSLEVYETTAELSVPESSFVLTNGSLSLCQGATVISESSINFTDCQFNPYNNHGIIGLAYNNQAANLVHSFHGQTRKIIELTWVFESIDRITSLVLFFRKD